ncbi:hypothetical protein L345_05346, partial [Ophiophagus hannah]
MYYEAPKHETVTRARKCLADGCGSPGCKTEFCFLLHSWSTKRDLTIETEDQRILFQNTADEPDSKVPHSVPMIAPVISHLKTSERLQFEIHLFEKYPTESKEWFLNYNFAHVSRGNLLKLIESWFNVVTTEKLPSVSPEEIDIFFGKPLWNSVCSFPFFRKVLEKVFGLPKALQETDYLDPFPSGFRLGYRTKTSLAASVEDFQQDQSG